MMTSKQRLIEQYHGPALRFWFEPDSSYDMVFESYEEFREYLYKDIARCPKGMSREGVKRNTFGTSFRQRLGNYTLPLRPSQ